jgi:hypothetical protein
MRGGLYPTGREGPSLSLSKAWLPNTCEKSRRQQSVSASAAPSPGGIVVAVAVAIVVVVTAVARPPVSLAPAAGRRRSRSAPAAINLGLRSSNEPAIPVPVSPTFSRRLSLPTLLHWVQITLNTFSLP